MCRRPMVPHYPNHCDDINISIVEIKDRISLISDLHLTYFRFIPTDNIILFYLHLQRVATCFISYDFINIIIIYV